MCAIMRAQACKLGATVDLSDSFFVMLDESEHVCPAAPSSESDKILKCVPESVLFSNTALNFGSFSFLSCGQ